MLQISEWLPNPAGRDTPQNEWVELYNSGPSAVNLVGWKLRTANGKTGALSGVIQPGEYKVFTGAAAGFRLRNTDETLTLIAPDGKVKDISSFRSAAEEGLSVNHEGKHSFFGTPTPGALNVRRESTLINDSHPYGVPLNHFSEALTFWGGLSGTAVALALVFLYIVKNSDDLSELFFGGN